jgi:hypothetical protein
LFHKSAGEAVRQPGENSVFVRRNKEQDGAFLWRAGQACTSRREPMPAAKKDKTLKDLFFNGLKDIYYATLAEEEATDESLSRLGEGGVNEPAMQEAA